MKKILALILTVVFVFALSAPTFASGGGIDVYLNGEKQNIDVRANNGRTLLSIRDICNMLELNIDYEAPTKKVKVYVDNYVYTFTLNSKQVLCNGKVVRALDTVPYLYKGHTYLPVRYVAELISADINWNSQQRAVEINIEKMTVENGVLTKCTVPVYRPGVECQIVDLSRRTDITAIGNKVFQNAAVSEVILPPNLKKIGMEAFYGSGLKKIDIPDSVTDIEPLAFKGCSNLEYIHLPDGIKIIYGESFLSSKITELVVPDKVTTIEPEIFTTSSIDKPAIKTVVLPPSVTEIHDAAFKFCDNLIIKGLTGSYAETYAKAHNIQFSAITESELTQILANR